MVSRVEAPPAKKSERGYGDENGPVPVEGTQSEIWRIISINIKKIIKKGLFTSQFYFINSFTFVFVAPAHFVLLSPRKNINQSRADAFN